MTANAITRSSLTPARGVDVSARNPAIWYPMHEGAGTTLAEAFGDGPTLTVGGTSPAATIWANAGCLSPNGTDHVATAAQQAYADTVANLASLTSGGMLLVGFEIQYPGANPALNYLLGHGRDASTAGYGGWWIGINSVGQPAIAVRGNGAASSVSGNLGISIGDTHAAPVQVLVSMWIDGAYLMADTRASNTATVGRTQFDVSAITLPSAALDGISMFAKRTSAAGYGVWTAARMNSVYLQKRAVLDLALPAQALADMVAAPREFPRVLRG